MAILDSLLTILLRFSQWILSQLPRSLALSLGRGLGISTFYIFKKRRDIALQNIQLAMRNELTTSQQHEIIKKSFVNLGINIIEFFRLQEINKQNLVQYVTFHGLEHLENAYADKKGVLALTAHLGNWELLAAAMSIYGFNTGIVVKSARQKAVESFLITQRTSQGLKLFSGNHVIKPILKHLYNGGLLGVVLDQSAVSREGILVPFFNHPASTMKSLAVLAMRTEAPVLPIFSYREGNHHHIIISPPLNHSAENLTTEQEILSRTTLYTKAIENAIHAHPEQWTWTHKRWKKRGIKK